METENIAALVILVITGIMIFFGTRGWLFAKPAPKARSDPSATTTAGTSGGAVVAPATPPVTPTSPAPAPAPVVIAASPRSYSWLWWVLIIAVVALGWWGYKHIQPSQVSAPPRVNAPGTGTSLLPQKTGERALRVPMIGGRSEIRKGECAEFEFDNSPSRPISRYQIVFQIESSTPTRHYLQIVGWPETFDYRQSGTDPVIFFNKFGNGRIGEPKFFRPGKVRIRLWSDSDIRVLSSQAELIYTG